MYRVLLVMFLSSAATLHAANETPLPAPVHIGKLPTDRIKESSGLVRSARYPEKAIYWTLSDSGDAARLFAIDGAGKLLRELTVPGAENIDWEDLSIDEKGRLVVADIGDNWRKRDHVTLYRLPEPDAQNADEKIASPQTFKFRYPKGEKSDAEALVVRGGHAYIFTKSLRECRCYRGALPEDPPDPASPPAELTLIATGASRLVTGAALSADGKRLALASYLYVSVIELPAALSDLKEANGVVPVFDGATRTVSTWLGQTEAAAWDGEALLLTTEGGEMYRISDGK